MAAIVDIVVRFPGTQSRPGSGPIRIGDMLIPKTMSDSHIKSEYLEEYLQAAFRHWCAKNSITIDNFDSVSFKNFLVQVHEFQRLDTYKATVVYEEDSDGGT